MQTCVLLAINFSYRKKSLERHLQVCISIPGIIYKFENQKIQTFFDSTKFMGDLPFSIYFNFETTSGKINYNFDKDSCLYLVSYSFVGGGISAETRQ